MGTVRITGPDGRTARLIVPEGATEDQIQRKIDEVKRGWPKQEQAPAQARSWSDVPGEAIRNIPESAGRFVGNIAQAVTSPVQTAKALGNTIVGGLENLIPDPEWLTDEQRQYADQRRAQASAVGQFFKDRYGSAEGIKNTLATDPVGAAADAATVLTGGGALAARAPGVAGQVGQAASRAGSMIDPIQATARAAGATGRGVGHVLGVTTGAGSRPIQTAYQAGRDGNRVFAEHMRGQAPMDSVVDMAESSVSGMKRARSAEYDAGMQSTRASQATADYIPIRLAVAKAYDDITYAGRAKDSVALQVVADMMREVDGFRQLPDNAGMSAQALDALKQSLGEIRQRTQQGTMARRTADQIYNAVKAEITRQVPEYASTMRRYSQASDKIKEMQQTFSISEKAAPDTTMRKLQSTMRNNVNTNYGRRGELLDELAKREPDLPNALAGQALNSATPRGLQGLTMGSTIPASFYNPYAIAAAPAFSPRFVGEAAYATGKGAKLTTDVITKLGGPVRVARALLASNAVGQLTSQDIKDEIKRALAEKDRAALNEALGKARIPQNIAR